jgi:hypothetical protein
VALSVSAPATGAGTPRSSIARRAIARAGGRVGPWASEATTVTRPSATSAIAASSASSPWPPASDIALTWASEPAASSRRRAAAPQSTTSAPRSGWANTTLKPRSRSSRLAAWKSSPIAPNGVSSRIQRAPGGPCARASSFPDVRRPVVYAREEVEVKVGRRHLEKTFGRRRRRKVIDP